MSEKKRYLVEFEIESHACLIDGISEQKLTSAIIGVEYFLSNKSTEIGNEHPLLCLRVLLNALDFGTAEKLGKEYAIRLLRCLTFATSLPCHIRRITRIVDWTLGRNEREALIITSHLGHDLPYKVLGSEILRTVEGLINLNIEERIFQALKWHYYGVLAQFQDEQFQYFWLALETLVQLDNDATKVHDACPKCRSALYCGSCGTHPTHRPYPKQKIEKLFNALNPNSGRKIFDDATRVRNIISHGADVSTFIQNAGIDLDKLVNAMGYMSFVGIVNAFQKYSGLKQEENKYYFGQTSTFIKAKLVAKASIYFHSRDVNSPSISDIPNVRPEIFFNE